MCKNYDYIVDINDINTWEDWNVFEIEYFNIKSWEELDLDKTEISLNRPKIFKDGVLWQPFEIPYDIPSELMFLYEKTMMMVFEKLEPEASFENKQHPEWYGKECMFCKLMTEEQYTSNICPFCKKELLPWPLDN